MNVDCDSLASVVAALFTQVTRVDVIGDYVHEFFADEWMVRLRDDGRTLKLYQIGAGEAAKAVRDKALVADMEAVLAELRASREQS